MNAINCVPFDCLPGRIRVATAAGWLGTADQGIRYAPGVSGPAPDALEGLSVVIPVYNEQTWIRRSIEALMASAERADLSPDVVVVDDGSTDGTDTVLTELAAATASGWCGRRTRAAWPPGRRGSRPPRGR